MNQTVRNESHGTYPTHLVVRPGDRFPIEPIPIGQLDYRWGEGSPDWKAGGELVQVYGEVVKGIQGGYVPTSTPQRYGTRYTAVREIFDDLGTIGLRNPLIVWQIEPGRYLTLVGNQRLTALLAARWNVVPCRVSPEFRWENEVLRAHPPEAIVQSGTDC